MILNEQNIIILSVLSLFLYITFFVKIFGVNAYVNQNFFDSSFNLLLIFIVIVSLMININSFPLAILITLISSYIGYLFISFGGLQQG